MKQTWISVLGNVEVTDGVLSYAPPPLPLVGETPVPTPEGAALPPFALARSNVEFDQGTISWESKLGTSQGSVQLMLFVEGIKTKEINAPTGEAVPAQLSSGLNVLGAPYGFAVYDGAWEGAGGAGQGSVLPADKWIHQKLTVRGSSIELFVEGVKVASTSRTLKRGQIGVLFHGTSPSSFRGLSVVADAPLCFAVMQFTEEFNVLYRDVIKPVCESYGYEVVRGDDFYTSAQIMDDVTQSIRSAALIIADVTPNNANVFYEVGYAHAINKPTILLSDKKRERLPFDISGFRTLFYENTIGGKAEVEERLRKHLDALRPK